MKKMCVALAIAMSGMFAFGMGGTAAAQDAAGYKIGVVDLQEVLANYNKRKAKYDELQREVEARQGKIDVLSKEIEADKARHETMRKSDSPNADSLRELETQIQKKFAQYKADMEILQREIDQMEEKVLREVVGDVDAALDNIGKTENYHLILNARKGPSGSVVYHSTTIDITGKVLATLNGGAPAASTDSGKKKN